MEGDRLRPPVREGRPGQRAAQPAHAAAASPGHRLRVEHRGRRLLPALAPGRSLSAPVFLEIFSGSAELSKTFSRHGQLVLKWDIILGPAYDLCRPAAGHMILGWLRAGQICGAHLGTPCTSFSRIRGVGAGPGPLRSSAEPLGLAQLDTEKDRLQVAMGNTLLKVSCCIFHTCVRLELPVTLENPSTSILWLTPQITFLQSRRVVHLCVTDFCMWGKPWRKRTAFLYAHINLDVLAARRCTGTPGICARTKRPHVRLQGRSPNGIFWTKIAEPYPRPLCNSLVECFSSACRRSSASRLYELMGH